MAIGAFVEGPTGGAAAAAGYNGRVTSFVVLSCIVAGSGGILFGYDLGISGNLSSLLPSLGVSPSVDEELLNSVLVLPANCY